MRIVVTGVKRYSFRQIILRVKRCEPIQLPRFRKFRTILTSLHGDFLKKVKKPTDHPQSALIFFHWTFN